MHPITEQTKEEDRQLEIKIREINKKNEEINTESNYHSPKFNVDLQHSRKVRKQVQYYTSWKFLPDGIHPGPKMARVWLLKIVYNLLL